MLWAVVTTVVIFIGGMLVVAYEATTADSGIAPQEGAPTDVPAAASRRQGRR
jgi:hypothetical protein